MFTEDATIIQLLKLYVGTTREAMEPHIPNHKTSSTTKSFWILIGQIAFKIKPWWIGRIPGNVGPCHILWLHQSLSSGYSFCTLHGTWCFIVQLQQSSMRHGGSVFSLLCIIECSACTVHKVTRCYRIKFHSENQNLFNMFRSSLLSRSQIKCAFGLDCARMLDFINCCFNYWSDFSLRLGENSNNFWSDPEFISAVCTVCLCKVSSSVVMIM